MFVCVCVWGGNGVNHSRGDNNNRTRLFSSVDSGEMLCSEHFPFSSQHRGHLPFGSLPAMRGLSRSLGAPPAQLPPPKAALCPLGVRVLEWALPYPPAQVTLQGLVTRPGAKRLRLSPSVPPPHAVC